MAISKMLDRDVRQAVKKNVIKNHIHDPTTLVVEELGVNFGRNRIDIAVINGEMHGYELKSDSDNLLRLPKQIEAYSTVMDKVTLVVGSTHADKAIKLVPDWWGVKIATQGSRGGIRLNTERRARKNELVDPLEIVKLAWKDEALKLLTQRMLVDWRIKKLKKQEIYQLVVDSFTHNEVRDSIRTILKSRNDWRSV